MQAFGEFRAQGGSVGAGAIADLRRDGETGLAAGQLAQDALEDAVLMGCDEAQIRAVFNDLVAKLENPYGKKS